MRNALKTGKTTQNHAQLSGFRPKENLRDMGSRVAFRCPHSSPADVLDFSLVKRLGWESAFTLRVDLVEASPEDAARIAAVDKVVA